MRKQFAKIILIFIGISLPISCRQNIELQRKFIQPIPFEKRKWLGIDSDGNNDASIRWEFRPGMARYLVSNNILIEKTAMKLLNCWAKNLMIPIRKAR